MKQSWTTRTRMVRSERGFTLVELLATIVILGIIAAIAVPSVGKLMDNSKKDAHVANAEQIIEAARLYVLSEGISQSDSIDLEGLTGSGYLDSIPKVPGEDNSYTGDSTVVITKSNSKKTFSYKITLKGANGTYLNNVKEEDLKRSKVRSVN